MVDLTDDAAHEVHKIYAENNLEGDVSIRLGIKGGGCAGFTYVFDFDSKTSEFDRIFDSKGVKIIVDRKSLLYVDGTIVNFKTSLSERGFKFENPKANAACGCGTSFTPKQQMLG